MSKGGQRRTRRSRTKERRRRGRNRRLRGRKGWSVMRRRGSWHRSRKKRKSRGSKKRKTRPNRRNSRITCRMKKRETKGQTVARRTKLN